MSMELSSTTDFSSYMPKPSERSTPAEAMVSRQAQEVQAAMVIAKRFPRDEHEAFGRIMKSCDRKILAESAMYEFPRGGSKVTGPSIRLAEVLAQNWGNIDYGILELDQKFGESTVMSYAWDLETNTRRQMVFTVKHERSTKKGLVKLEDSRDIYEMVANQGARRLRACILGVIPGDIVDASVEKCKQTLINGHKEPLSDRIRKAMVMFEQNYQVNKEMLEKYIGCRVDAFSEQDFLRLTNVWRALKDGMAKRDDYFDISSVRTDVKSKTEEEFQKMMGGSAYEETAAGAEQPELPLTGSEQGVDE